VTLPNKILVVDNDQSVINQVTSICQKHRVGCIGALTWQNALYHFNQARFDTCLVSYSMDEMSAPVILQKWRNHEIESKRDCVFIVMTGRAQLATESALITELEPALWAQKPLKEPKLLSLLGKAVAMKSRKEQMNDLGDKLIKPLLKAGDYQQIVGILDEKISKLGTLGLEMSAQTYEKVGELQRAIDSYQELSKKFPSNMKYINEIGRLEMARGNMDVARAALEKADKVAPLNVRRMEDMVTVYLKINEPDSALEKCRQILASDPEHQEKKFDFMEQLDSFGYNDHAQRLCQDTAKPLELIRHFNNKGVLYSKDGDYVSAIDEYTKAQKLIPKSTELYRILYNEALARINLKNRPQMEEAEKILQKCLELNPKYDKAKEKLSMVQGWLNKAS